jgi:osmotically-inducible protein OsmY
MDMSSKNYVSTPSSKHKVALLVFLLGISASASSVFAEEGAHSREITAQDQSLRPEALELTRKIRRTLTETSDLSIGAQNIAIVTDDSGTVHLRGMVISEVERVRVFELAKAIAGTRVQSHLSIAQKNNG